MKTFNDLEFKSHPVMDGVQAKMHFENGYGVSVVRFRSSISGTYGSYTNDETEWELAVLENDGITYNTPITDDVIGHLKSYQVSHIMSKVQKLPRRTK